MLPLYDLTLRPMEEKDLVMVLNWRNSEHVRRYSLTDHIIKLDDHQKWYRNLDKDPTCEWLIAELKNEPIGVVSITDINSQDGTCTWGMYIGENVGNLGVGVLLEIRAIDRIFNHHGVRKLWGQALKSNRILMTHKRFGFVEEGILRNHVFRNGNYEDIILVALFAEQWPEKRKEIFNTFNLVDK
ncbi:MAG: UDP-4-amino-4,6-dideoxy-N-acetyl-beta-L-altrosamine N-acetyltransferase [Pseudomonadota bacterium]